MYNILIDTNAYVNLLYGSNEVYQLFSYVNTVFISSTVLGELYAGFFGGTRFDENEKMLLSFIKKPNVSVVAVTHQTARIFGEIKNNLKKNGTPLPINDIWIAAHAFETGALLITFDQHFKKIPNLRCKFLKE